MEAHCARINNLPHLKGKVWGNNLSPDEVKLCGRKAWAIVDGTSLCEEHAKELALATLIELSVIN